MILYLLGGFGEVHRIEIKTLEQSCLNLNPGFTTLTLDKQAT